MMTYMLPNFQIIFFLIYFGRKLNLLWLWAIPIWLMISRRLMAKVQKVLAMLDASFPEDVKAAIAKMTL